MQRKKEGLDCSLEVGSLVPRLLGPCSHSSASLLIELFPKGAAGLMAQDLCVFLAAWGETEIAGERERERIIVLNF